MLTFTTGNAISLYADQSSFGQEKGSLSGETFAKATLVANNKTNEATDNYYVYFNIENNTFKYTLGNDKPELILTVTGPDGNEVTSLPGLVYKTVQDRENKTVKGFDVTTTNGLITIANKKTINATPSKEEQYTLKLTFVNYEGDQTANASSGLSAKVMIQKEMIPFHETCNDNTLACHMAKLYTGTQEANNIYYHDASLTNGAGDNSYRYAGASETTNNYVCFGSTESPCPTDNLYRIIGVFNGKVKLVKYNDIGTFDTSKYNATSFADTEAYNALNSTFIDTFDIRWKNMISTENWISGIVSSSSVSKLNFKNNNTIVKFLAGSATSPLTINWYTAKNWYIVESGAEHKLSMKIGTISISELRYAMNSSNWNLSTLDNTSWLYYNKNEAFYLFECFTDNTISDTMGYYMTTDGILYAYISPTKISPLEYITTYVRPSFYLVSSVLYKSGIGTSSDAIYITD